MRTAELVCLCREAGSRGRNAELRGEVARSQASPRRSMSTNTLRMMALPYDDSATDARGCPQPFTMRDVRTGMKDSRHERTP